MRATHYRMLSGAIVAAILAGCVVGILVPAGLGWDFANFYDAGHRVAAGQVDDLYQQHRPIEGRPPQGEMRFWSAPLSAALLAPLGWLSPETALVAFKVQNTLALLIALAVLYRHYRRFAGWTDEWTFAALFASLCLIYQPFWTIFRVGGQTTPTVFLLLVLALLGFTASRFFVTAALLVAVAMIKPTFAPMLVFLAVVGGMAFARALVLMLAAAGLLSIALMGWPVHREFLNVLLEGGQMSRAWLYNSSLYVPLENFRLIAAPGSAGARALAGLEWLLRIAVIALFVVMFRASHRQEWPQAARRHFEFLMALCFWLLASQLIWEHYLAALFVPLGYFVARRDAFSRSVRILVAAIFALAIGQNLILVQYVSARLQPETTFTLAVAGLLKAGPLVLLLVLLSWFQREIFASYRSSVWRPLAAIPLRDSSALQR